VLIQALVSIIVSHEASIQFSPTRAGSAAWAHQRQGVPLKIQTDIPIDKAGVYENYPEKPGKLKKVQAFRTFVSSSDNS
jgi:hypothetical protein